MEATALEQTLYLVGSLLLTWAGVVGTASVFVHARVAWRGTIMGRHLMSYMAIVAAVLDLGIIRFLTGDSWWFQIIRLIVFIGVPLVMTQRLVLQIRAQHIERQLLRTQGEVSGNDDGSARPETDARPRPGADKSG